MLYKYTGLDFERIYLSAKSLDDAISKIYEFIEYDINTDNLTTPATMGGYLANIGREWNARGDEIDELSDALHEFIMDWQNKNNWDVSNIFIDNHY